MNSLQDLFAGGDYGVILADMMALFVIIGGRALGFVMIHPIFGRFGINFGLLRGSVIVAMTLPLLPTGAVMAAADPSLLEPGNMPFHMLREVIIGVILGLITGIPFWAAIAAGEILDTQRGASSATDTDPTGGQVAISGDFFFLVAVLLLTAEGLLIPAVFGPLLSSYQLFPLFGALAWPDPGQGHLLLALLDDLLRAGLILAMPILIPLLLTEVVIAISTRYMPQINPTFLSMSAKQVVYLLMLVFFMPLLGRYMLALVGHDSFGADALAKFLSGAIR